MLAGCAADERAARDQLAGRLSHPGITEASGLACSRSAPGRLWVVNDGGSPPALYAAASDGSVEGSVELTGAGNVDWEDIAAFDAGGGPRLLIADVGDNDGRRDYVTLIIVAEPTPAVSAASVAGTVRFRYPGGPRDAEAVAVEGPAGRAWILTKRTMPAELYRVPLDAPAGATVTAEYVGPLATLPRPDAADLDRPPGEQDWHWQPTAMDFAADGRRAVVLTYRAAYVYERDAGESWAEALARTPLAVDLGGIREAEAACLAADGLFVTVEGRNPPLYYFELSR